MSRRQRRQGLRAQTRDRQGREEKQEERKKEQTDRAMDAQSERSADRGRSPESKWRRRGFGRESGDWRGREGSTPEEEDRRRRGTGGRQRGKRARGRGLQGWSGGPLGPSHWGAPDGEPARECGHQAREGSPGAPSGSLSQPHQGPPAPWAWGQDVLVEDPGVLPGSRCEQTPCLTLSSSTPQHHGQRTARSAGPTPTRPCPTSLQ